MENTEVITLLKDAFELKRQEKYKHAMELLYKALALCPENVEILSQIADVHMLLDNPQSAGTIYERLSAKQVDNVEVMERLCSYYISISNFDKAKSLLEKFVVSYPSQKAYEIYLKNFSLMNLYDNVCLVYDEKNLEDYHSVELDKLYGIALYNLNKLKAAKTVFERFASKNMYDDELQYFYAQTLYLLGESQVAYEVLKQVVNSVGNPKIYNLCGELELDNEKFESAISFFIHAVKLKSEGKYYYNLATAYFLNGQLEEAKGCYLKSISISPDVDEYRYSLAYLFYKQNDLKKAKQIVDEILDKKPEFNSAILLNASILYDEQKFFFAQRALSSFVGEKDSNEEYLKLSAKINKALYKLEATQHDYEKLILINPSQMDYKLELARLYFDRQKFTKSAQLVVSIMSEAPKYVSAYILAAKIYIKMYDFKNVVKMCQKVLDLDLNNEEAFYLKALGQMGLFDVDGAIATAKQLLDYNPHKSEAYALLGAAYVEKSEYEIAQKYYNEAILINSKNSDYFFNLALLQEKSGQIKEALRLLFVAHSLSPENKLINTKLVELYISEKQYKNAMKLLYSQLKCAQNIERKKELTAQLDDISVLYKKANGLLKYFAWVLFKI